MVEDAKDVAAIERTREFRGLYHVLGGAISPIAGIGPDDLRIAQLMTRLADGTDLAAQKLERVLTNDPAMGVIRHADAGYQLAKDVARERGVDMPSLEA